MNEEKQFEELIEIVKPFVRGLPCGEESGSCELTDCRSCNARNLAKAIIEKDYRKRSEGEWIKSTQTHELICNLCGAIGPVDCLKEDFYASNFCPNCGAKMKGGE